MAPISKNPSEVDPTITTESQHFKYAKIFYKFIEVWSCLDFGFFTQKSFRSRMIWKFFTIFRTVSFLCAFFLIIDYDNLSFTWSVFQLSFYFLNVLVLVCVKPKKTLCQLLYDLELIDKKILTDNNFHNLEIKLVFSNIFFISAQLIESYFYCFFNVDVCSFMPMVVQYFYYSTVSALNVLYVSKSFLFYSLYCRLNIFVNNLKAENIDITSMQRIYKNIADVVESYVAAFEPLFFLGIAFNTMEMMAYTYSIVGQIIMQRLTEYQLFTEVAGVSTLIIFYAPSLFAEWVANQPEKIKQILQSKLLSEKDKDLKRKLEQFLRYVEARRLRFTVYKVIPLDAKLIGLVLNFVVTYVIVIVQFIYK